MTQTKMQRSERFAVGALLAVTGGYLDAYTYLCRGHVFANAQTGNMVLLAINVAERNIRTALLYFIPIAAFFVGILVAECIRHAMPEGGRLHWRHMVLTIEAVALLLISLVPIGVHDMAVNIVVSFVCALQVEAFRKVRGYPFASTMCTGNLRSGTEALYHFLARGDKAARRRSLCYFGVIACFLLGAAIGCLLSSALPRYALAFAVFPELAAFALMYETETN